MELEKTFEDLSILIDLSFIKEIEFAALSDYHYKKRSLQQILWQDLNTEAYTKKDRIFFIQTIGRFPSLPIITDTCKTHEERRILLKGLPKKIRMALGDNKLRLNKCSQVVTAIILLEYHNVPVFEKYKNAVSKYRKELHIYHLLTEEQKIALVKELSSLAKKVCISLCTSC